jgi:hypothetical protein
MADPILQVVLHHAASLPDTPAVCALLCTSTAAAATVHKQLEGALHVKFCPTRLQQLAAWLQHHGSLLKSLDFEPCTPKPSLKPAAGRFSLSRYVIPQVGDCSGLVMAGGSLGSVGSLGS